MFETDSLPGQLTGKTVSQLVPLLTLRNLSNLLKFGDTSRSCTRSQQRQRSKRTLRVWRRVTKGKNHQHPRMLSNVHVPPNVTRDKLAGDDKPSCRSLVTRRRVIGKRIMSWRCDSFRVIAVRWKRRKEKQRHCYIATGAGLHCEPMQPGFCKDASEPTVRCHCPTARRHRGRRGQRVSVESKKERFKIRKRKKKIKYEVFIHWKHGRKDPADQTGVY